VRDLSVAPRDDPDVAKIDRDVIGNLSVVPLGLHDDLAVDLAHAHVSEGPEPDAVGHLGHEAGDLVLPFKTLGHALGCDAGALRCLAS